MHRNIAEHERKREQMRTELRSKLTPKMRLAAQTIATGVSLREAAEHLGFVSYQTLSRWQQQPRFQSYLNERLDFHESQADGLLRSLRLRAVQTLAALMENENPQISLKASEAILDRQKMVANAANEFRQDSSTPISVGQIMKGLGIRYEQ